MYSTDEIIPIHYQRKVRNVQRMNGNPMHKEYNLAQHGYFVLSIAMDLSKLIGVTLTVDDVDVIMRHDFAETVTSDLPYPVKNLNKDTQEAWETIENEALSASKYKSFQKYSDTSIRSILNDQKWWIFKFSDMLELSLHCWDEMILGNNSYEVNRVICNAAKVMNVMLASGLSTDTRKVVEDYIASSKYPDILVPTKSNLFSFQA